MGGGGKRGRPKRVCKSSQTKEFRTRQAMGDQGSLLRTLASRQPLFIFIDQQKEPASWETVSIYYTALIQLSSSISSQSKQTVIRFNEAHYSATTLPDSK